MATQQGGEVGWPDCNIDLRDRLRHSLPGSVWFGVEANRRIGEAWWNAAAATDSFALVECVELDDVRRAVRVAADFGAPLSVLGGGHDWAGRAACRAGITVDLRRFNAVALSADQRSVTLGGAALIDNVLANIPDDLAMVTGTISTVGVTGLTLGGGYGRLNSRFGLALDTMARAEVVLADGSITVASEQDDAELFWALRGGGGNFGVVTSITLAVHRLPSVLTGTIFVPLSSANAGLLGLQAVLDEAGDDLSVFSALMTAPSGDRGLILGPMWTGEAQAGERALRALSALPGAQTVAQGWSSYKATYSKKFEQAWPKGCCYHMDAHNVQRLDEVVADALVECAHTLPSDADCIMLHDFRGACARVAPDATAFSLRRNHFNVQVLAAWNVDQRGAGEAAVRWVDRVKQRLSPLAVQGGYPNVLGPQDRPRVEAFYGDAMKRLTEAKRRYDPYNLFRSNTGQF